MSFWKDRSVLVTGASGLLGSWLTAELVARRAPTVCLVRDWNPESRFLQQGLADRVVVVRGELEDLPLLQRTINEYEIDTVFHLGAQTIVGAANRHPVSTFETNIRGTWNVLEACRLAGNLVKRVLVASSDKAYGAQGLPYRETMPLEGRYPYDVSKSCVDLITLSYFHTYGLPVAITRCANLFGGGDLNFSRLVPGTIRSVLRGQAPVIRSDGKLIRDYFYVKDAALAYLLLAEKLPEPGVVGEAFNFGIERPLSVLEIVRDILRLCDRPSLEPTVLHEAVQEIPEQWLSSAKARDVLGWRPSYSLESGLLETIDWYRGLESVAGGRSADL